jgi:ABC-type Fe3+-hydroxamate transport system substrate-binding protein
MAMYTDQTGKTSIIPVNPTRIVSLVPSQTELLYDLGLDETVVGITKFCVHPKEWFRNKKRIGGTKSVHIEEVKALQPDLIIANKEENIKEQVDELSAIYPVWTSDISNLQQALQMITALGEITGSLAKAQTMIEEIKMRFAQLPALPIAIRTGYLIWREPYMTIGVDTFIHDMLAHSGFENIFADKQRYPTISIEEIKNRNCQLLLLSSEPFPFKQKHIQELQKQLPSVKIVLADGEMFSWYGSRLLLAPGYFKSLIRGISDV